MIIENWSGEIGPQGIIISQSMMANLEQENLEHSSVWEMDEWISGLLQLFFYIKEMLNFWSIPIIETQKLETNFHQLAAA